MESTGPYWKPVLNVLEDSITVMLANGQDVKGRKGHKTDWNDCRWLAHLLRHGLIRLSFIPPRCVRDLRDLTRRRKQVLSDATSERNRVQKVLEEANVKLGSVLTDIFGVSGQLILEALLAGKAPIEQIAELAKHTARKKIPAIIDSLEGHAAQLISKRQSVLDIAYKAHPERFVRRPPQHPSLLGPLALGLPEVPPADVPRVGAPFDRAREYMSSNARKANGGIRRSARLPSNGFAFLFRCWNDRKPYDEAVYQGALAIRRPNQQATATVVELSGKPSLASRKSR
jgi:hypothetical protein